MNKEWSRRHKTSLIPRWGIRMLVHGSRGLHLVAGLERELFTRYRHAVEELERQESYGE